MLELLTVIAIIGILAAISVPVLNNFKPNYTASATRQLLDDLGRARQLAISQRTTVYMVFVPGNFWTDPAFAGNPRVNWFYANGGRSTNLFDKQLIGYNFVSVRSLGDQPGRPTMHYLSTWKTLPEGSFIALQKFTLSNSNWFNIYTNVNMTFPPVQVWGFDQTLSVPFPTADAPYYSPKRPYVALPYIAFDYMGRVARFSPYGAPAPPRDVVLPLANGNVLFGHDAARNPTPTLATVLEQPPGNATNNVTYNLIYIDWVTGRARAIRQEVQ